MIWFYFIIRFGPIVAFLTLLVAVHVGYWLYENREFAMGRVLGAFFTILAAIVGIVVLIAVCASLGSLIGAACLMGIFTIFGWTMPVSFLWLWLATFLAQVFVGCLGLSSRVGKGD